MQYIVVQLIALLIAVECGSPTHAQERPALEAIQLSHMNVSDAEAVARNELGRVTSASEKAREFALGADKEKGILFVRGNLADIERLKRRIRELDKRPPELVAHGTIVRIAKNDGSRQPLGGFKAKVLVGMEDGVTSTIGEIAAEGTMRTQPDITLSATIKPLEGGGLTVFLSSESSHSDSAKGSIAQKSSLRRALVLGETIRMNLLDDQDSSYVAEVTFRPKANGQ